MTAGVAIAPTGANAETWGTGTTGAGTRTFENGPFNSGLAVISGTIDDPVEIDGYGVENKGSIFGVDARVTNNGTVSSTTASGQNGVDVKGYTPGAGVYLGSATYSGAGAITGGKSGVVLIGTNFTVTSTSEASIRGNNGDGIRGTGVTGGASFTLTGTTVYGTGNGVVAVGTGGNANVTVSGGSITSLSGDGIQTSSTGLLVLGGATNVSVSNGAIVAGGANGISASATGGNATVNLNNATVTGHGADGVKASSILATAKVTTSGNSQINGQANGITLAGSFGNVAELNGGTVTGVTGHGVNVTGLSASIFTDGSTVSGGQNGINALITGGSASVSLHNSTVTGLAGDGVNLTAVGALGLGRAGVVNTSGASDIVGAGNGIGLLAIGANMSASASVDADGYSVVGRNGMGISAIAVARALGGAPGVATTNVTGNANISGSRVGVMAIAGSVALDPSMLLSGGVDLGNLTSMLGDGKAVVNVDLAGDITGVNGSGVVAVGNGNGGNKVDVTTGGTVTADNGVGILAGSIGSGGVVNVTNNGHVSSSLAGIIGFNTGGDVNVTNTASSKISIDQGGLIGMGAVALGGGNATATNNGIIDPPLIGMGALTVGTGTATVTNGGGASVDADLIGAVALNVGDGKVVASNHGTIGSTSGALPLVGLAGVKVGDGAGSGVDVSVSNTSVIHDYLTGMAGVAVGDDNSVQVSNIGFGVVNAGLAGIIGVGVGDRNTVDVENSGVITTAGAGMAAYVDGSGNRVMLSNSGQIDAALVGVAGFVNGDGNQVLATNDGSIQANTSGMAGVANGAGNALTFDNQGRIVAGAIGVGVFTNGAANSTAVSSSGSIISGGVGVLVAATGDDAQINIGATGPVTGRYAGISAIAAGNNANVTIASSGQISSSDGVGISGVTQGGTGSVGISVAGTITAATTAVFASSNSGNVSVSTASGSAVTSLTGSAIHAIAGQTVSLQLQGAIRGSGSDSAAVVSIVTGTGASVNLSAGHSIGSNRMGTALMAASGDLVFNATGGSVKLGNDGVIVGRVNLPGGDSVFNNRSSNSWYVTGESNFGGGASALNNTGRIVAAFQGSGAEATSFKQLATLVNGDVTGAGVGMITMQDERIGASLPATASRDTLHTGGNYVGVGNGKLVVDAWLGGSGSTADRMVVDGTVGGVTSLVVNDVNPGAGAYNPNGSTIVVAKGGATSAGAVVLDPSSANAVRAGRNVVDKGLFFYDVALRPGAAGGQEFVLVGAPDTEAYELPVLVSAAQSIWHDTTGVWLDRQADLRNFMANPAKPGNVTPGVWAKAIGSWESRDNGVVTGLYNRTYGHNTSYNRNTFGLLGGIDFGQENVARAGDALVFGLMGGYISSNLDFKTSATSARYQGGTAGVYATYLNSGFFVDALAKVDLLNMDYRAPSLQASQGLNATTLGFTLDTGYRFNLGANTFIEPVATLSYARTTLDQLLALPGAMAKFGANESLRGGLGARVGGSTQLNDAYRLEASLTGRVWNEFRGVNRVLVASEGAPLGVEDNFRGAFGEVAGTLNVYGKNTGLSGFVSASYKFNRDLSSGSIKGGVRYQW